MQYLIQSILKNLAKKILKHYNPIIIGVTGSMGKTSTKEMIVAVLRARMRVRGTLKSYNNELGLPLSIIGAVTPGKSVIGWVKLIFQALRLTWSHDQTFPEALVLEMGADHPGDIGKLVSIAPPVVGVLTAIAPAHLEFYSSVDAIAREKRTLIEFLPSNGLGVLNVDDELVWQTRNQVNVPIVGVGSGKDATIRALDVIEFLSEEDGETILGGIRGVLAIGNKRVPFIIPDVLGVVHVQALLFSAAVGLYFGMTLEEIVVAAKQYSPPPGRMRLLAGIKNTVIIDDSYNAASPMGVISALETLGRVAVRNGMVRYAVLGDMRELGSSARKYHEEIGRLVPGVVDVLITVGAETEALGHAACAAGFDQTAWIRAEDSVAAGTLLQACIKPGDIILVKGSQNTIRLERTVKEIMAEPLRAKELLVRQTSEWRDT